ncbi:MAG TPA: Mov34/MPN/PAD-1 family protein [archaeon]|nr:Mov34/MPN/PAD-1 family protein [archaeon]
MYQIKKEVLESIIIAAKNIYPNEFFSMLGGKNRIIEELVIVPATFGKDFSSYRLDLVPFDREIIGTVHSHPSEYNHPSDADLDAFRKSGEIHLIISYPYDIETIRGFGSTGKKITLKVI